MCSLLAQYFIWFLTFCQLLLAVGSVPLHRCSAEIASFGCSDAALAGVRQPCSCGSHFCGRQESSAPRRVSGSVEKKQPTKAGEEPSKDSAPHNCATCSICQVIGLPRTVTDIPDLQFSSEWMPFPSPAATPVCGHQRVAETHTRGPPQNRG